MRAMRTLLARLRREDRGAAAVEFVLILIPMVMLTLGAISQQEFDAKKAELLSRIK